jgi:uncharacterized protein (DUF58 family)
MMIRRRAWLSREGWYYCAVLVFIVAGAVLKSVNLLVVLAGVMIAPLFINWRLVMASLSGLVARRKLPEQICSGEPLTVELHVENPRRWMSSWMVTVEDWIERVEDDEQRPRESRRAVPVEWSIAGMGKRLWKMVSPRRWFAWDAAHAKAVIGHVPACGESLGVYRLLLHRRGRYRFGPLRVSTRFPLGLVLGQFTQPAAGELIVAPRIGRLSPEWMQLVEAELLGDQRRHPQRGISEGDYYGLRPWQSGDSMRWVHWRTTAKLGRPIVRQFERRRNRDVVLVLDPWLRAAHTEQDEGLLELAFSLAATAIADLASRGHSRLTFAVAAESPRCWTGPASPLFCQELLAALAVIPPISGCYLAEALEKVGQEAPIGARFVIISPRSAEHGPAAGGPLDLSCDPEDFCWIDVSSKRLGELFTLD